MKPYKRILRPVNKSLVNFGHNHLNDIRYCQERYQLIHAYHILENDLKKLFDYIELNDQNKNTFSHRIYELILRSCTEFEANCKGILIDNAYNKPINNLNITDYFLINNASKLNQYEVKLNIWTPEPLIITPFESWAFQTYSPLPWYRDYNSVKHDRNNNFNLATLENLINCMAGLLTILASQFAHLIFSPYNVNTSSIRGDDNFISGVSSVFSIKFPENWTEGEIRPLDWENLKNDPNPFNNYPF